jgi:hypothetical protein
VSKVGWPKLFMAAKPKRRRRRCPAVARRKLGTISEMTSTRVDGRQPTRIRDAHDVRVGPPKPIPKGP